MIPRRRRREKFGTREADGPMRNPRHLKWVRGFPCAIAGKYSNALVHVCEGRMEAAHVRTGTDGGTGLKPSDQFTIPLCSAAHAQQHAIGERTFEMRWGIDMKAIAAALYQRSPYRRQD